MTKKDFIAIAGILQRVYPHAMKSVAGLSVWSTIREELIAECKQSNERFNEVKFRLHTIDEGRK